MYTQLSVTQTLYMWRCVELLTEARVYANSRSRQVSGYPELLVSLTCKTFLAGKTQGWQSDNTPD